MKITTISPKEAKYIVFQSQLLIGDKNLSTQKIIEHLGYIQIDTISVVERAHHHILWTRNKKYKPEDINNLVKKRKVFEHWTHAASYLPIKDYRYTIPLKQKFQEKAWYSKDKKLMKEVLKRIRNEGPLRSKDFKDFKKGKSGWWEWKPAKNALEQLFLNGDLEISHREGFQKVFDLTERVIPATINTKEPTESEYIKYLITRTLRSYGLASVDEISYLKKKHVKNLIEFKIREMIEDKKIVMVKIKGHPNNYFALKESLKCSLIESKEVNIFSPFDNLLIQRKRLREIFGMNYNLECYVPAAKRKYGYFSLPVFKGVKPVSRIDCKANRKTKTFSILSIHNENKGRRISRDIHKRLEDFAKFNQCDSTIAFTHRT